MTNQPAGLDLAPVPSLDVVMLATADWDHPFWTNKQHVACSLAQLGHRVLYIESLGLRPPRLERQDLGRVLRRLRRGLMPPRRVMPGVWVWAPLVIPAATSALLVWLNQQLFNGMLALWRRWLGFTPDLLWTYNPLTGQWFNLAETGFGKLVYHCVDDLTAQPCMPADLIRAQEEWLCRNCDQVFVTSPELLRTRGQYTSKIRYWPNVADVNHFAQARQRFLPVPEELRALPPGPRLGFIGAVSGYKLDLALLSCLASHRPDAQIVLIGRVGEGDPGTDLTALQRFANVHLLGPRSYQSLPGYLRGFDLALLPCPLNAYTRSMFPMKFFEYLAAGVPVVATALPALQEYASLATICAETSDFLAAVDAVLSTPSSTAQRGAVPLSALPEWCSYRGRTEVMLAEVYRPGTAVDRG